MSRTVLIVDDSAAFRTSAIALLQAEGFLVVGDGFEVAARLARDPHVTSSVVLISTRSARSFRRRLPAAEVVGFLSKQDLTGPALAGLLGDSC